MPDHKNPQTINGQAMIPSGGALGLLLKKNSSTDYDSSWGSPSDPGSILQSGCIRENVQRQSLANQASILTLGQVTGAAIMLYAGEVVSAIQFMSGSTALATPTHQFFELRDSGGVLLGQTSDDTTTAWGSTTLKKLTLSSPYTVPTTGAYYVCCVVAGATANTLMGVSSTTGITGASPVTAFKDAGHTGITTPGTSPSTATLTATSPMAWASVY